MTQSPPQSMGMRPKPTLTPKAPAPPADDTPKSSLVSFLEESCRDRKRYEFELTGFRGLGGRPIPKYLCRVLTKSEANKAIVGATRYVDEICRGTSLAKDDPDLLLDAKACWALYEACRDFDRPDVFPAFPSPTWMMDNLTTDQIAVLYNNYAMCVDKEGPMLRNITDEMVDDLSSACVALLGTELPGTALNALPRESLVEFAIRQAVVIAELKLELAPHETGTGSEGIAQADSVGEGSAEESSGDGGDGGSSGSGEASEGS